MVSSCWIDSEARNFVGSVLRQYTLKVLTKFRVPFLGLELELELGLELGLGLGLGLDLWLELGLDLGLEPPLQSCKNLQPQFLQPQTCNLKPAIPATPTTSIFATPNAMKWSAINYSQ